MYPTNLSSRYTDLYFTTATVKDWKPLLQPSVVWQKIRYTHENPTQPRWQLSAQPEDYTWSSAAFYTRGDLSWPFLTHFWYGEDWPSLHLGR